MPTGGRRSKPSRDSSRSAIRGSAALTLAWRSAVGAGFALPRDAGRRPALRCRARFTCVGGTRLRGPAGRCADRRSALQAVPALLHNRQYAISWRSVVGAGFALPRDAGRRPALRCRARFTRVGGTWFPLSRAITRIGDTRSRGPAGRGADRRSALQAVPAILLGRRYAGPQPSHQNRRRTADRAKNKWQRTSGSLRAISGESVKGGYPLSQSVTTNRNSPPRAEGAQGSSDCRREAPGGSGTGAHPPQPVWIGFVGRSAPVPGPLRTCAGLKTGAPTGAPYPPNSFFAAVMKRGHWGVSGLFGGSQTLSTSCQASASGTPLRRVR